MHTLIYQHAELSKLEFKWQALLGTVFKSQLGHPLLLYFDKYTGYFVNEMVYLLLCYLHIK